MDVFTNVTKGQEPLSMSAQPHLMDIIQVRIVCWFSHGLDTFPESYLKPWEEIQHSQDLKIESANKFQHVFFKAKSFNTCLVQQYVFKEYDMSCIKSHHYVHKAASFCTVLLKRECSVVFLWKESQVMFKATAYQSSLKEVKESMEGQHSAWNPLTHLKRLWYSYGQSVLHKVNHLILRLYMHFTSCCGF